VAVYFSISPLQLGENIVSCVVVTDLSEQKSQEQIFTSEKLSRAIFEQVSEAVVVCDSEGIVIRASRAAYDLCGENPLMKLFEDVFRLDPPFIPRDLMASDPMQSENSLEVVFGRGGRRFHLLLNAGLLPGENQQIIGCVVTMTDISEIKEAELALQEAHDELEDRIRARTAELELLNKELQDFVFIAAHDLREPLRKIRSFGDLLLGTAGRSLSEDARDYARRMQKASARMQQLLDSLLAYSRVTTKADLMKKTNLNKSVEVALSNLEIVVREKKARIEIEDLPEIDADRVQVIQLFQNIIENALKFNREGIPPQIRIHGENVPGEKPLCRIWVKDDGIGFDEKYLEKIFMPFQRLHGRSHYGGVGMGLAICRKIAERHDGEITARSRVGEGAAFIVTLPVAQNEKSPMTGGQA
jgi:PAS domain S-box-containing protein